MAINRMIDDSAFLSRDKIMRGEVKEIPRVMRDTYIR